MQVDIDFHDKVFEIAEETGLAGIDITKQLARDLDGLEIRVKKKKQGFQFFK